MKRILLEGPAVEPVLLPEIKAHLRLDGDTEDDLLDGLITAARVAVETEIRRVLIAQRWRAVFDDWLWDELVLPVGRNGQGHRSGRRGDDDRCGRRGVRGDGRVPVTDPHEDGRYLVCLAEEEGRP